MLRRVYKQPYRGDIEAKMKELYKIENEIYKVKKKEYEEILKSNYHELKYKEKKQREEYLKIKDKSL